MPAIQVAAIQTHPEFGNVAANVEAALAAVPTDCDLAVLPELFNTGYQFVDRAEAARYAENPADGFTAGRLRDFAAAHAVHLVGGIAERDGERIFNSALLVRPDGSWDVYRKVHLFWDEKIVFDPGDLGFPVFAACGTTVGLMICFDWIFPEAMRTLALRGAHLVCHPSNLLLPYCHDAMITRCLENRIYAATANRVGSEHRTATPLTFNGLSQIVSPLGRRLAACAETGCGVAAAAIDPGATGQDLTPRNNLRKDRRPDCYDLG
jgi:predicted amidohydrolase